MPLSLGAGIALGSLFLGCSGVGIVALRTKNGKTGCKTVSEDTCIARVGSLKTEIKGLRVHIDDKMDTIIVMLEKNGFIKK